MRTRTFARGACWLLLLAPLVVTSTPPSIPWDIYDVDGMVVRASGSPANHTVVLVHKDYCDGVRQWCRLSNCEISDARQHGPFVPLALTGTDGGF